MPKVSVIMPCYKSRSTLAAAVGSVRRQSMTDWELIAVDDGSPEKDGELLETLAADEPRLRVIRQENAGVSAARNAGILAAGGDWLFFLDADDRMEEKALETLLSLADDDTDILCGAYRLLDRATGEAHTVCCARGDLAAVQESLIRGDSALNSMCARLYRRRMIAERGILAPAGIAVGEDVLFNLEAFAAAGAWRMTDDVVYTYDYGGESAMVQARRDVYRKSLPMLLGIGAFLRREGLATARFRAHIDAWLRMLRADRGRLRAAAAFDRGVVREITRDVEPGKLTGKERLYYAALRLCPPSSILLP
ncbi:MAG: glycosyltransferase family 2 protein [Clostridia bacterium]|nr:glycosyltransferase family 2 protein [Clostridia bacterium]